MRHSKHYALFTHQITHFISNFKSRQYEPYCDAEVPAYTARGLVDRHDSLCDPVVCFRYSAYPPDQMK